MCKKLPLIIIEYNTRYRNRPGEHVLIIFIIPYESQGQHKNYKTYFVNISIYMHAYSFVVDAAESQRGHNEVAEPHIMTIPHEWRVKSVNSPRESKKIVSRERSSSETIFLLSRGQLTDFTRHEL